MIHTHTPSSLESDRIRPEPADPMGGEASIFDLLRELRDETTILMRQEVELARVETAQKVKMMLRNVGYLALGGAIAFAGFMFLLWSLTLGLMVAMAQAGMNDGTAAWFAPLLVGVIVMGIAGAFVFKAISTFREEQLKPQETVETMKENKQWLSAKLG